MLTKTDYLAYRHCPLAFWLSKFRPETGAPPDPSAQRRLRMGSEVDRAARDHYPDGRGIPYRPHPQAMAELTSQALSAGASLLFQATFMADDLLVKTDVLQREGDGWRLVEVKSSKSVKEEHLLDVAFQFYVLLQAGLSLAGASVLHLNDACRAPDLTNLFVEVDVTADVTGLLADIGDDIDEMRSIVARVAEPAVDIGRHCKGCAYQEHCWDGIEGFTIYHIPRLNAEKEAQLRADGVVLIDEVPPDFPLTNTQRDFIHFHTRRDVIIDRDAIRRALSDLRYPLFFLDFETIDHAVPIYDACGPYQQVPFQYSCHILYADDRLEHREYLHLDDSDPRPTLLQALLGDLEEGGQVVAYNVPFERGVLARLAGFFPAEAPRLQAIIERLWDQLPIFRRHYRHYGFGGSNSLKNVLPVIAPDLSYETLPVQDGAQAQVAWEELLASDDERLRESRAAQLRDYCALDTLAMVRIHHALQAL